MMTRELFYRKEFFTLPIADIFEMGLTPNESRTQPSGFMDDDGRMWIAIITEDGLKRQIFHA